MLALSYLEPCTTVCSSCRPYSAPKEVFINPSCVHAKQCVRVCAPVSVIAPTHVCDRTYMREKDGSHASEVLITHISHTCRTRVSITSPLSCTYLLEGVVQNVYALLPEKCTVVLPFEFD